MSASATRLHRTGSALDGPFADDLVIGEPLPRAPSITLDASLAAAYQAVVGDPLRLALSDVDSAAVTGAPTRLVNPALVLQVTIGQSTVATRRVIANLFYRDVALHRQVHLGDTLTTTVTPRALRLTRPGERGRRAKVLLDIETLDQQRRRVARFERLALLPCRDADAAVEHGETGGPDEDRPLADYRPLVPVGWRLDAFPDRHPGGIPADVPDPLADTVSSALELVRLTQNQAAAHRDPARGISGRRLVYGGHAIGLAQASMVRVVPGLVTVLGWRSCNHLAPVFEGDVLDVHVSGVDRLDLDDSAALAGLRVQVSVRDRARVLDWRPVVLLATGAAGPDVTTEDNP